MLKIFAVALFAIGMSVGLAEAKGQKIPGCALGRQATAPCNCGRGANGKPLICQKGQWCHTPFPLTPACTQ